MTVSGADGGLTIAEVADLEDLFTPSVLREILAHHRRAKLTASAGRLGLFVHLNGKGEPVEYDLSTPAKIRRKSA